tara:strand:- start:2977 stop:3597 length:621 start_codon:yes stop_codon:yes gene_type:complete
VEKKIKMLRKISNYYIVFFSFFLFLTDNFATEKKNFISIGNENAKVIVKVFSSLTCPYCADFHKKIFYNLKEEFIDTNILKFEHHSFPLDLAALNAEKVLRCIKDNKKRIDFLNELYKKQDVWAAGSDINSINSKLIKMAKNYDLNDVNIKSCLENENLEDEILNVRISGSKKYSITSTPTILINEKIYEGKYEYESFKKVIKKYF